MSKIKILPEQLSNQIAAGEVVERPASVVKELVENSLDAGARRIEIEIEGGGTRLIRIIDDGYGMGEDDLLMCLERHGTSKITREEDLGTITTLGFRGEAIPSIGSVSKMRLISRVEGNNLGTTVVLEYGTLLKVHESGCSFGTTVEARNLFGNTPARKKFLRTTRTEIGHIEEVIKNYGLGCPEISFILKVNGRENLRLDNALSLQQRLAIILRYDGPFLPVTSKQTSPFSRNIEGFLVPPERVTAGPSKLRIFVNGRAVRDRMVTHGVAEGLRGFLMKGKNPSGLIHLHLQPEEIDVNVHPAKHEIRFRHSREIHDFITLAVSDAMKQQQRSLQENLFHPSAFPDEVPVPIDEPLEITENPHGRSPHNSPPHYYASRNDSDETSTETTSFISEESREKRADQHWNENKDKSSKTSGMVDPQPLLKTTDPIKHSRPPLNDSSPSNTTPTPARDTRHNLLVIGQFDNLYIFCKSNDNLVVIDQHAAHERLIYEKLREQYFQKQVVRQTLMFPETIELTLFQSGLVEKNNEQLDRMGFSISPFGGNTFIISAVPALGGTLNSVELLQDVLEQFGSEQINSDSGSILDTILATMACKAAIKAGTQLSVQEINQLLNDMARADLFSHCPHGRPVVKQFTKEEVKKWFYRT